MKIWLSADEDRNHRECGSGLFHRNICIFGVRDLPLLTRTRTHSHIPPSAQNTTPGPANVEVVWGVPLFANKIYSEIEPLTLDCLESWLPERSTFERTEWETGNLRERVSVEKTTWEGFEELEEASRRDVQYLLNNYDMIKNHIPCEPINH